jgi:hypothetical protein
MEVKTNLPALTSRVMTLLKRKKFRPSTLESYQLTWRRIQEYMTAENLTGVTKEVGEAFIKNHPSCEKADQWINVAYGYCFFGAGTEE